MSLQTVTEYSKWAWNGLSNYYNEAAKPGEKQKIVQAAARSLVGIASIYTAPYPAGFAAVVAAARPDIAKHVVKAADGMISGLWNKIPFRARMPLSCAGIAMATYYDPTSVFNAAASICSAKLGAEYGIRNRGKEEVAAAQKRAEEEHELES